MCIHPKRLGLPLAILALGSGFVRAQDPGFDAQLKLRTGYGLTATDDKLARRTLGFGLEVGYATSMGRLGLEAGYQYKAGDQYLKDVTLMPTGAGATVDPAFSVDSRKSSLAGITLRLSFEKPFTDSPWSIRGGVQVGGAKFRQEYIGDVTDNLTYEDTYNGAAVKTEIPVSPFLGVGFAINVYSSLELNAVYLLYSSADYVHVAGTAPGSVGGNTGRDFVAVKKRAVPHLELGYAFHF